MGEKTRRVFIEGLPLRPDLANELLGAVGAGESVRGRDFSRAAVLGRNLEGADLAGADLSQADFTGANLKDADLRDADLRRAVLRLCSLKGAKLAGATLWGAELDQTTFQLSQWSTEEFAALHREHGFQIVGLDAFPADVRQALGVDPVGLTLFFPGTLDFLSKALVESVLALILGDDASACRSTYEPTQSGGALVRLSGLPDGRLVRIADQLTDFFNRPARAEITKAIEGAVEPAIDRAIEKNLPEVVSRAIAPMAVLQVQLGDKIMRHIDAVYQDVSRTEIKLSEEAAAKLREMNEDVLDAKLAGWKFEPDEGKLIRSGAWAVTTGAAGSGLFAALQGILF